MSVQNRVFIVTGANGHLGSALIRLLKSRREEQVKAEMKKMRAQELE